MLRKIVSSSWVKFIFSAALIFFAFRKVNFLSLFGELTMVPTWFVVAVFGYYILIMMIGSLRWSMLLFERPSFKDVVNLTKAGYLGGFYSLFFPTAVAGDLVKWLPLLKKYPEMSKTKIASSVLIDRIVGFSAFVVIGFLALILGKLLDYEFPSILLWLFSGLIFGVTLFYVLVYSLDFERLFGGVKFLSKMLEIVDIFKRGNKQRILKSLVLSIMAEPIWMLPFWFYSQIFNVGMSLIQVYIFVPVVSLILVLPISIAGFGARENLFLYFLAPLGFASEKILAMSTLSGIMSVLVNLGGGLLTFEKTKE